MSDAFTELFRQPPEGATKVAPNNFKYERSEWLLIKHLPAHSEGTAQVKEDRQRAAAQLSAHFPPPVLRTLRYRERTVRQRFGLNYCPEHAKSNGFLTVALIALSIFTKLRYLFYFLTILSYLKV